MVMPVVPEMLNLKKMNTVSHQVKGDRYWNEYGEEQFYED